MRKAAFVTVLLVLGIFLVVALPAAAAPRYVCKDLGTLPFPYNNGSRVSGINAVGQVAGYSYTSGGSTHGFLWSDGVMHDLGTLPAPYNAHCNAYAVNTAGKVVGSCFTSDIVPRAFLYSDGAQQDLGTLLSPYNYSSVAYAINASGQVVGVSSGSSPGIARAFLYSGGNMQDLSTLPAPYDAWSQAWSINANGVVVGESYDDQGNYQAFLFDGTMHNLSSQFGIYKSTARAINDHGQAVGQYQTDTFETHAYLYYNAGVDLGTLGGTYSTAMGINNFGQVVGAANNASAYSHAFIYSIADGMQDLNDLVLNLPAGIILSEAVGINDRGQIIANGNYSGLYYGHAFLLNPVQVPMGALELLLLQ
jgi:probable HAF family extracellular repeat protein